MNAKLTKNDCGGYEYKGYSIYKTTNRSGAYNPWKIVLSSRTFMTLRDAKKYIDSKEVQS